jgi:formamidopyrimidine-DNA glycosylase
MPDHRPVPELPEVQALTETLAERLTGRRIESLLVASIAALKTFDPPARALHDLEISGTGRRGKFLIVEAAPLHLVIHLARAGWVRWRDDLADKRLAQRGPLAARLRLEGGGGIDITEQGTEKRLSLYIVRDPADVPGITRLGADVLDDSFDVAALAAVLRGARSTIKAALADQELMAGVGNAWSDEILHAARMSPFLRTDRLTDGDVERLWHALRDILGDALERARERDMSEMKDGKRSSLQVHGRTGQPCPVCGDTVRQVAFASRSFQYCPTCQTGGRIYADRRLSRIVK